MIIDVLRSDYKLFSLIYAYYTTGCVGPTPPEPNFSCQDFLHLFSSPDLKPVVSIVPGLSDDLFIKIERLTNATRSSGDLRRPDREQEHPLSTVKKINNSLPGNTVLCHLYVDY